jgi:hypothetical protein
MSQAQTIDRLPGVPIQKRRRRYRLWVGVPLLLFVLWLTAFYLFFVYFTDRDLREAMAEADHQSPEGWRLEDIEARREQIPDEENAALLVLKVPALLPTLWPITVELSQPEGTQEKEDVAGASAPSWDERLSLWPPEVQLDAVLLRDLRASLAEVKAARGVARKLIGMTRGRFPNVGHYNLFLNSRDVRSAATLLGYEAALAVQDGDADAALDFGLERHAPLATSRIFFRRFSASAATRRRWLRWSAASPRGSLPRGRWKRYRRCWRKRPPSRCSRV